MFLCDAIMGLRSGSLLSARTALAAASFLKFFQWDAPGCSSDLLSSWEIVNDSGVMDKWSAGVRKVNRLVGATEKFRNDMCWRRRSLEASPAKRLQHSASGSLAWSPRLPDLRERALSLGVIRCVRFPLTWPAFGGGVPRWAIVSSRFRGPSRHCATVSTGGSCGRWERVSESGVSSRGQSWYWYVWITLPPLRTQTMGRAGSAPSSVGPVALKKGRSPCARPHRLRPLTVVALAGRGRAGGPVVRRWAGCPPGRPDGPVVAHRDAGRRNSVAGALSRFTLQATGGIQFP